jgi:DnaJ like chaperone protein
VFTFKEILAIIVVIIVYRLFTMSSRNRSYQGGSFQNRRQAHQEYFHKMLMALSAAVMKADGKVLKVELNVVKEFLSAQFGPNYSKEHLKVLKQYLDQENLPLEQICGDIKVRLLYEARVQLIHYLFHIAKSDGDVATSELNVIERIANNLEISLTDFESVKNMFYRNVDSDYKILGVESSSSDDEIKKAYRKMAIKFHPDKVAQLGEEHQKAAKEKFQQIQDAYEALKKRRGFK